MGATAANAQWYVGTTGMGVASQETPALMTGFSSQDGETQWGIAPEVGYNFNEKWTVGLGVGYTSYGEDMNAFGVNPYVRYFLARENRFGFYLQGDIKYVSQSWTTDPITEDINTDKSSNYMSFGIMPGVSYMISSKFGINSSFGFLGYSNVKDGDGIFGLDLSAQTLNFGLTYNF